MASQNFVFEEMYDYNKIINVMDLYFERYGMKNKVDDKKLQIVLNKHLLGRFFIRYNYKEKEEIYQNKCEEGNFLEKMVEYYLYVDGDLYKIPYWIKFNLREESRKYKFPYIEKIIIN